MYILGELHLVVW